MFSFFRKKPDPISLEQQLQTLAECGITLSPLARIDDLFMFHTREEHEAEAFKELIPTLGHEMERDDFSPICHRLWMCDYERIEDDDAYENVIKRFDQMSEHTLPITNITSHLDFDAETAWVEFDLAGTRIHWDAKVDNDWLDPDIIVKFMGLLKSRQSPFHLYSNHTEFGQSAFFACLTPEEFEKFSKLTTFKLLETDKLA